MNLRTAMMKPVIVGVTNAFLVNSKHEFAMTYNDESVLENYHCSTAFDIMLNNKHNANVFESLEFSAYMRARFIMIHAILNTDMARHFKLLDDFRSLVAKVNKEFEESEQEEIMTQNCCGLFGKSDSKKKHSEASETSNGNPFNRVNSRSPKDESATIPTSKIFQNEKLREAFLVLLVHVADIGNPFKTFDVYKHFADALCVEFQHQVFLGTVIW